MSGYLYALEVLVALDAAPHGLLEVTSEDEEILDDLVRDGIATRSSTVSGPSWEITEYGRRVLRGLGRRCRGDAPPPSLPPTPMRVPTREEYVLERELHRKRELERHRGSAAMGSPFEPRTPANDARPVLAVEDCADCAAEDAGSFSPCPVHNVPRPMADWTPPVPRLVGGKRRSR